MLHAIGRRGQLPTPPLNLIGDYAGAVYLAYGILAAVFSAGKSGRGQVVDAAMVDTSAHLMTSFFGLHAAGRWNVQRGSNVVDSGAFYYDVFECRDGKLLSVAPIEAKFFRELMERLGIGDMIPDERDPSCWENARQALTERFKMRTRDDWCAIFEGSDACVAPVLDMSEAPYHLHLQARGTFVKVDGIVQPAPAPRFSETVPDIPAQPPQRPDARRALAAWLPQEQIETLLNDGTVA